MCSGDQLELMCTTTGMFLNWSYSLIPDGRVIQSTGQSDQNYVLTVNNTVFTIYRLSDPNSLPLMSRLLIRPVSDDLNGTVVTCVDLEASISSSTIINIVDEDVIQGGYISLVFAGYSW